MDTIFNFLGTDHRHCDGLFADAEGLVHAGRWEEAQAAFAGFADALERHFGMEEEVAFPEFEERSGTTMGPTRMMRMEHLQMRQALTDLREALTARRSGDFLAIADTFMVLMQQHNMKEEQILYPMIDRVLGPEADTVIERMKGA